VVAGDANDESTWLLCGELNGRNSYGAYVGYKRFYSGLGDKGSHIEAGGDDYVHRIRISVICLKSIYPESGAEAAAKSRP